MFKKLFCNHEFVYIDKEFVSSFPGSDKYLFRFMCKKCKKQIYISSLSVEEVYCQFVHDLNEMIVIDGFVDVSKTNIVLPTRFGYGHQDKKLTGYAADKTIEYFKNKYSVDITQIRSGF